MNKTDSDHLECMLFWHNLDRLHTTPLGAERIKRNLGIETDDIVKWCRNHMEHNDAAVAKYGKNWYVTTSDCCMTVNATTFTIITAHKVEGINKEKRK